ncbi:flavin-containing monooxygenase [Phycicoccus avicenniae]|uniref:flavin-containing monooxygenase n=1 Tax=Phycicoccus avicenniae TaxID=2828860 RepID=UPI003D2AD650
MPRDPMAPPPLDVDVLVVGAGLSGIDMACRLAMHRPELTWAVLEARSATGGTWDLFRYPGIRSDSDMYTLGFPFRPWRGRTSIAPAAEILRYLRDTADEHGVTERTHLGQRVTRLEWSGEERRWTVTARTESGEVLLHRARFVHVATGYYAYDSGHVVEFPRQESFTGEVVHPQHWPEGMAVAGRRFVVVGSGATAITLVPALVEQGAASVTMLQRSPSYVAALPNTDVVADGLRRVLPGRVAHQVVRGKNVALSTVSYQALRRWPQAGRRLLRRRVADRLPDGYPVDTHFNPRYDPWDERVCVAPDGDLLDVLADGRASVVTATIDGFEPEGVRLAGGEVLPADVVVTATGLRLEVGGGAEVVVDGERVDLATRHVYKGCMISDVPNLALSVGYTNASWTLKADLTARWVCHLLGYLDRRGLRVAVPRWDGSGGADQPLLGLSSGYVRRGEHLLPKQGSRRPWRVVQSYVYDVAVTRFGRLDDGVLELS